MERPGLRGEIACSWLDARIELDRTPKVVTQIGYRDLEKDFVKLVTKSQYMMKMVLRMLFGLLEMLDRWQKYLR